MGPLILSLYGHTQSGGYWEDHCDKHLLNIGFEKMEEWFSTYWHEELSVMLIVYVDDFKMAGPKAAVDEAWRLLRTKTSTTEALILDEPTKLTRFLGCEHQGSYLVRD